MMAVNVVDLVSDSSDDEKEDEAIVEYRNSSAANKHQGNGGKRKIEESKKEPNRKNPWFRNTTTTRNDVLGSKITFAQRVSPGLEEQKSEDDDEVILLEEKPKKFISDRGSAKDAKKVSVKAATTGTAGVAASPPPQIWLDSDNAIITCGLLPSLRALKGGSVLVSNCLSVAHIQQMDRWSCGFRNIQMLLSGLVPLLPATHPYFQSLMHIYCQEVPDYLLGASDSVLILPSLTQLQQQLEAAWREGFDPNGADHFKHSVVGRPSRIGAVEVGFVFSYMWLDACVVQFIKCFQSRRLLPPFVYHYFRGCSAAQSAKKKATDCLEWADKGTSGMGEGTHPGASCTTLLPMYLQWEGHSVTIVGLDPPSGASAGDIGKTNWSQWNLLVFCPGRNCSRLNSSNTTVAPFRLSCRQLLQKDCQLVLSSPEPLTPNQRMERKFSANAFTAAQAAVMEHVQRGL